MVTISSMESTVNFLFSFLCYICTNTMHTYVKILACNLPIICEFFSWCVMYSMLTVDLAAPFVLSLSFFIVVISWMWYLQLNTTQHNTTQHNTTHTHKHTRARARARARLHGVTLQSHGTVQINDFSHCIVLSCRRHATCCHISLLQAHCSVLLSINQTNT